MNKGSTMALRATVTLIAILAFALCLLALPAGISMELKDGADFDDGWILVGLYIPAVPFFYALYQALKLLKLIDRNKVFTEKAVNTLKNIKYCGLLISGLFLAEQPYIFYVADRDDAPGLALLGFAIIGASFVLGTAAALFQQMLQNTVDIKSENDLAV